MNKAKELQQLLKDHNLYDGEIDGVIGDKTLTAVTSLLPKRTTVSVVQANKVANEDQITANFYMSELTHSNTAVNRGINNTPSALHKKNLIEATKNLFQPTRDLLGAAMLISSGYRSPALNRAVGGSSTSAHSYGLAIDFTCPSFGNTRKIASFLVSEFKKRGIKFDQLILEFPDSGSSWIHLGYKSPSGSQRNQVLTAVKQGGKTTYLSGLH